MTKHKSRERRRRTSADNHHIMVKPPNNLAMATKDETEEEEEKLMEFDLNLNNFSILHTIALRAHSRVRQVTYLKEENEVDIGRKYQLKVMEKSFLVENDGKKAEHFKHEMEIQRLLYKNQWLPRLYGIWDDELRIYMLNEYIQGTDLFLAMREKGKLHVDEARFYLCQVMEILDVLHSSDIIHRDIKPDNFLVKLDGNLMLGDLSLAKVVSERTFTVCGTPEYVAPDVFNGLGYAKLADYWSMGVLLYEMIAGHVPFQGNTIYAIYDAIQRGSLDMTNKAIFKDPVKGLLNKLLERNRSSRIGAKRGLEEIRAHSYFKGIQWSAVRALQMAPPWPKTFIRPLEPGICDMECYPEPILDMSIPIDSENQKMLREVVHPVNDEILKEQERIKRELERKRKRREEREKRKKMEGESAEFVPAVKSIEENLESKLDDISISNDSVSTLGL